MRLIAEEKITDKYRLSAQVYQWLLALVRTSHDTKRDIGISTGTIIEQCKQYIRKNYASPLTLDSLAEYCGINKHYLCRLFQKSEQTSPLAYVKDRRVEAALALLRTTELPIHEIGHKCGFESPSYFGKVFRDYMSLTPKEYRMKVLEFPFDAIYYE
ncbi:Regulatory protein SoxS [compost metagenome]